MSPAILFSMAAVVPTGRLLDMSEASINKPGRLSMHCHPKLARELYRIEHILHGGLTMFKSQSQDLQHGFQETASNPQLHRHSSTTSRHGHTKAAGPAGLRRVHYRVASISLKEPIYIYICISHIYYCRNQQKPPLRYDIILYSTYIYVYTRIFYIYI